MEKRRRFIKTMLGFLVSLGAFFSPIVFLVRDALAKAKKIILPKGTRPETLKGQDPAALDTRNLELTPTEKFGTMGTTKYHVDVKTWRLEVSGHLERPLKLSYQQILQLPAIERNVLLICPGVFSYNARWKGISVKSILEMANVRPGAARVSFSGPLSHSEKVERFPLVNGEDLPLKHGFPLRVIAEGYYGSDWVKYVYKMAVLAD